MKNQKFDKEKFDKEYEGAKKVVLHHWATKAFNMYQSHGYPPEMFIDLLKERKMLEPFKIFTTYLRLKDHENTKKEKRK